MRSPRISRRRLIAARNAIRSISGWSARAVRRRIVATIPYFGLVPQVLLKSDLIFTAPRRFAQHYAAMLPLAVLESPVPFPRIKCYQLSLPQPDQPTDVAWLRSLMAEVSEELTGKKAVAAGVKPPVARCGRGGRARSQC